MIIIVKNIFNFNIKFNKYIINLFGTIYLLIEPLISEIHL